MIICMTYIIAVWSGGHMVFPDIIEYVIQCIWKAQIKGGGQLCKVH